MRTSWMVQGGLVAGLLLGPTWAQAAGPEVRLHLMERPPYYLGGAKGEPPSGLVVAPLLRALRQAGLPHRFEWTPALRQLRVIEEEQGLDCGVGWFENPERRIKGKFSAALYQDRPLALLLREGHRWHGPQRMNQAVGDASTRLLVKTGFSYGAQFDGLLALREAPVERSVGDMINLGRMLLADRADWMPIAPEEGELLLAELGGGLRLLFFSDASSGSTRHLYCNRAVPEAWLQALNQALARGAERAPVAPR